MITRPNNLILVYATEVLAASWKIAQSEYGHRIGKMPKLVLNNRLSRSFGRAWLCGSHKEGYVIDLSTKLYNAHPKLAEKIVIPHEVAHFVAYRLFDDPGHGVYWKNVMRECFNLKPSPYVQESDLK